jgi:hypothetical protein
MAALYSLKNEGASVFSPYAPADYFLVFPVPPGQTFPYTESIILPF